MPNQPPAPLDHRMVWIYPDNLLKKLNATPTLEITRGLRRLGWQVDLLMGGLDGPREIQGVEVTGISRPNTFIIKHFFYHVRALKYVLDRWNKTSVVFFQTISTLWIILLRLVGLLKQGKSPLFVMDIRTMQMEKRALKDKLRGQFALMMGALANQFADGQTTITRRMAEALRVPKKKLWGTWPSGVDVDVFSPAIESREWPQNTDPIQLVYIGTLAPGRDLMPLCHAVEKANQEGMCFELSLVGDGEDCENLAAFAAHTAGKVRLLGRLPHDQMSAILANMHIGALPFPDRQEFRVSSPIKLFEYMAAGMPIFATRISCHTDVIGDCSCVFWAENSTVESLTAALRDVWNDRQSLASRGILAAKLAQDYTWAASAKKLADALEYGLTINGRGRS